jgi:ferredoxin
MAAKRTAAIAVLALAGWIGAGPASAIEFRFPKPDFQSGYTMPQTTAPAARARALERLDMVVLLAALTLAAWIALRRRSRREMVFLMVFSIVYFGFWRKGCVCPVGAVQNVTLAFADSSYAIPFAVIVFFALPLVFALFFGRVFCAGVCPLGAVQDAVVLKPLRVPLWLEQSLGVLACLYLGVAVLLAALGAGFAICRFDPFIGFFRLGGDFSMLALGAVFLLVGTVIARPYCRYLCPYGVLLGWMSRLSRRHATITPDECIQCRLCEDACPFNAIRSPTPARASEPRAVGIRRLAALLVLAPVLVAGGAWVGARLHPVLARFHPRVQLAEQVLREKTGKTTATTLDSETFAKGGQSAGDLFQEAHAIMRRFEVGGWFLGGFVGLVFFSRLIGLSVRRTRPDYEPDRGLCLSCARCFESCPREHLRIKERKGAANGSPPDAGKQ